MILFDLKCATGHVFEAWFPDSAAFETQSERQEIACPACGDKTIRKAPMAPHLGKSAEPAEKRGKDDGRAAQMREMLGTLRREVEANCDYVGDKFAEEARKIHFHEVESRNIYGEATSEEAANLTEEGVEVQRIPWLPRQDS